MKKISKAVSFALALVMVIALLAGCSSDDTPGTTTAATTTRAATTTAAGATTTTAAATTTPEERITMTMFAADAGLGRPDGVSASDNPFINIVEDYANVNLEVEVPQWADFGTRLNLLFASGDLPDVLHTAALDPSYQAARDGAFIDIYDYWEGSEVVQKYITREFLEMARTPDDGGYHRIPMKYDSGFTGKTNIFRKDLIQKYSPTGTWPVSVDEYVATFEAYHEAEPDVIMLTMRERGGMQSFELFGGGVIPYMFASSYRYRFDYQDNKVYAQLQLPEFKAALELIRELYQKGIFDQEFATSDAARYNANFFEGMIAHTNTLDQLVAERHIGIRQTPSAPERAFQNWQPAPLLEQYPSEVKDSWYGIPFAQMPIVFHGLWIPVSSKDYDRAWRVIEGFASDELFELFFYGIEGVTFEIVNGERVFDWDALQAHQTENRYGLQYMVIAGFNNGQEVSLAKAEYFLGGAFFEETMKYQSAVDTLARNKGYYPFNFMVDTERSRLKIVESEDAAKSIAIRYSMGVINSEQYDTEVAQWLREYGFIMEDRTAYINNNRDELLAKGVALAP